MRIRRGYVDDLLLQMARKLAKPICAQFKLKPKKIEFTDPDDPEFFSYQGLCDSDGFIGLDFRNRKQKKFITTEQLLDVLVHELAHLKELKHNKRFWSFYKKMLNWSKKNLMG